MAAPAPSVPAASLELLADRHARRRAALRWPLRGQRRQQRRDRPATRPLHRPGLAGAGRGRPVRRPARPRSPTSTDEVAVLSAAMQRPRRPALPPQGRGAPGPGRPDPSRRTRAVGSRSPMPPRTSSTPRPATSTGSWSTSRTSRPSSTRSGRAARPLSPIAGQRIVSTTGIKCEGNAVQLQGVPYPQPYVIEAVGDPATLNAAIDADYYVDGYRDDAENAEIIRSAGTWSTSSRTRSPRRRTTACCDLNFAQPLTRARRAEHSRRLRRGRCRRAAEPSATRWWSASRWGSASRSAPGHVVRDHDRHGRALRRRLAGCRALVDHRARRLGGVGGRDDPRLEARGPDLVLRLRPA